ncbi:alpha/beta fold hydrolase [Aquihabitans sp. McL0605]|uniref:alpha/beta fold hydrolase n=1 Tax=Aquihabitans sp. McL0605 TaxID=3415671 RepID=UPI003CF5E35C
MGTTDASTEPEASSGIDVLATSHDDTLLGPGTTAETRSTHLPRLARHTIALADGHKVAVSVCGRGVPIVLIHGYSAEGMLYAQTLSRIVTSGFKVVAIDVANHGGTQGLPAGGANFEEYTKLLGRVVDELGINKAVFAGHSMGGRLVTELAAREPERALAVILLDAIVGEPWDRIVALSRFNPFLLAGVGGILMADSFSTLPFVRDPVQAVKFGRLAMPMVVSHAKNPLHLIGPGVSILRSRSSKWMLEKLGREGVPVIAIHGDRDIVVPLSTARSAAKLAKGMVVVVEGGRHSWLLRDPETLPAILREMFDSPISQAARARDFAELGLAPDASLDEIEAAFYEPDAPILALTPEIDLDAIEPGPLRPKFHWHVDLPR